MSTKDKVLKHREELLRKSQALENAKKKRADDDLKRESHWADAAMERDAKNPLYLHFV